MAGSSDFSKPSFKKMPDGTTSVRVPKDISAKKGEKITVHRRDGGVSDVELGDLIETTSYGEKIFKLIPNPKKS